MGLSGRKEKIVEAVVDSYINSCEPVSSAEIKEKHLPALSSATIRNELAALEEMGYLAKPHTSAGRIPTAEAYRLYVEKMMPRRKLTASELKTVKRYFNKKITEIDDILKNTAKVISEITNLTSVAYAPDIENSVIRNIKIVKLTPVSALIIIVTDREVLKDAVTSVPEDIPEDYFEQAGRFATSAFAGHRIYEAAEPKNIIKQVVREYEQIFNTIIKILKSYSKDEMTGDLVLEGSAKLLEQPEYANLNKAKAMLELLDTKKDLIPVLAGSDDMSLNILISKDNEIRAGMPECAIVTANYSVNGVNIGKAGVIGPIRMDYPKIVSVLDYIGQTLNQLPSNGGENGEEENDDNEE